MKTGKGGYWIKFDSKEEEQELYRQVKAYSSRIVHAIGSMMLIEAEYNDNKIKEETKKED